MKRLFDLTVALFLVIILFVPIILISIVVKLTSSGPVLYWSDRVGQNNRLFSMPKFRSMHVDTPSVATHLLDKPDVYLTSIGSFLRKTSLDEIPQLWSILKGDMSFVGPRPALFSQDDLIALRTSVNIHLLLPGLTGWAQVNGRDEISIPQKVKYDLEYAEKQSILFDLKIFWLTIMKVIGGKNISH